MNRERHALLHDGADLSRRRFIIAGSTISGSLLLGLPLVSLAGSGEPTEGNTRIGFFINILENGDVIVGNHQPELGQGLRTTLPMLVAEELDIEWDRVRIESMPLGIVKTADGYAWKYGSQGVGGSTGLTNNWTFMREVGATGRLMLMQAAAQLWNVPIGQCSTRPGEVICESAGKKASYGELVKLASTLPLPEAAPALKPMDEYRIVGKPHHNKEVRDIITGKAQFGSDLANARYALRRHTAFTRAQWHRFRFRRYGHQGRQRRSGCVSHRRSGARCAVSDPRPRRCRGGDIHLGCHPGPRALKVEWTESPSREDSSEKFWQQNREMISGTGADRA